MADILLTLKLDSGTVLDEAMTDGEESSRSEVAVALLRDWLIFQG